MPRMKENSQKASAAKKQSASKKPSNEAKPETKKTSAATNSLKKNIKKKATPAKTSSKAAAPKTKKALPKFQKGSVAEAFEKLRGKFTDEELDEVLDLIS